MAKARLVLFDIDGTLIDTGGAGAHSWAWAFERLFGQKVEIAEHSTAGMTDPAIGRVTFAEVIGRAPSGEELTRLLSSYQAVLPDYVSASPGYRVLPGAHALLERLARAGVALGLTTGGLEAVAHTKLGRGGLNRFFLVGGYGSDSEDRVALTRTAIERAERLLGGRLDRRAVFVVGDTPLDIAAAKGAGAVSVGVASGSYDVEQLKKAAPDHVLSALTDPFPGLTDPPPDADPSPVAVPPL